MAEVLNPSDVTSYAASDRVVPNAQTGTSYTLALSDQGGVVECNNSSPVTLTVPPNSSVAFPVGAVVEVTQVGAGLVTLTAGAGVTVHTPSTLKALAQYASVKLRKSATDVWYASGNLSLT